MRIPTYFKCKTTHSKAMKLKNMYNSVEMMPQLGLYQEVTEVIHIACLLYADHVHRNLHYFKCTYNI